MADRVEIKLAIDTIALINRMGETLRSAADTTINQQNDRLNAIIDGGANQTKLVNGLTALGIDVGDLNTDRNAMISAAQHIMDNIDAIVKL